MEETVNSVTPREDTDVTQVFNKSEINLKSPSGLDQTVVAIIGIGAFVLASLVILSLCAIRAKQRK